MFAFGKGSWMLIPSFTTLEKLLKQSVMIGEEQNIKKTNVKKNTRVLPIQKIPFGQDSVADSREISETQSCVPYHALICML